MKSKVCGLLVAGLVLAFSVRAQETGQQMTAEQFVASLHFKKGEIAVPEAKAHFRLSPAFRYLDKDDTRRVLEDMWGNPPDDSVLGMIVPVKPALNDDDGWAVVVTYSGDGYVSDIDASTIDYPDLLKQMQESTREQNSERKRAGYGVVDLVGWAVPPRYDADSKKLYWAKELAFNDNPQHTLNYDIRVLGRNGYLSLNAVADMSSLTRVQQGMQQLLPMTEFDAGARYADYDKSTDKTAAYGLAALIGGGLAAKAGLFAKLGLLLAKFWKLGLVGLVLLGSGIKRLFGSKRKDERSGNTVS